MVADMSKLNVLHLCHNHPTLHPGGTEIFARDLFRSMKDGESTDGLFIGCVNQTHREQRPGTVFQGIGASSDEMLMWTGHFDNFYLSQIDMHGVVPEFSELLRTLRPDVVHFHHILLMGVEMIFLVKRILPQAKIVASLHDYYSICANDGLMLTTSDKRLCQKATPDACHRCFPHLHQEQFVLRERHLKTHFALVDRFISPSEFLRQRYIDWGIDADRIEVVRNARPAIIADLPTSRPAQTRKRNTFAYMGNINPNKGVLVLLEATRLLAARRPHDFKVEIHGGTPFQTEDFKTAFRDALAACAGHVAWHGAYAAADAPKLMQAADWMVMPSIWWENAPLVIEEAYQQGRPVICSDIGGMAESVTHEVDGLTFRAGDAHALANAMERALTEPDLWDQLAANIAPRRTMAACVDDHLRLYRDLLTITQRESA
jgi:glycosyltransferase involved in cell wall biosynthesis